MLFLHINQCSSYKVFKKKIHYNIYSDKIVLLVLQASANSAACFSEVDSVFLYNSKTTFHVSSVPFLTPKQSAASFSSGGILLKIKQFLRSCYYYVINFKKLLRSALTPIIEI